MTTVTLLIFSGRPDPTWELTAEEVSQLVQKLRDVDSAEELSNLGYRGFLVQSDDPGMPSKMIVRSSLEVERFLLSTSKRVLDPDTIQVVEQAIE
jgi:hypothetical protein